MAPFLHGALAVHFHLWNRRRELPLFEGALRIFIDWVLGDISGLEACRRMRCAPLTSRAHITMVLEEGDG